VRRGGAVEEVRRGRGGEGGGRGGGGGRGVAAAPRGGEGHREGRGRCGAEGHGRGSHRRGEDGRAGGRAEVRRRVVGAGGAGAGSGPPRGEGGREGARRRGEGRRREGRRRVRRLRQPLPRRRLLHAGPPLGIGEGAGGGGARIWSGAREAPGRRRNWVGIRGGECDDEGGGGRWAAMGSGLPRPARAVANRIDVTAAGSRLAIGRGSRVVPGLAWLAYE
jgi:hypothetical protein